MKYLTDADLEKIREYEGLKREVREELEEENAKSGFAAFAKHPAVLLFLGFILTTVVGSYLTSSYSQEEWKNQQLHLEQRRALDTQNALIEKTFTGVAETNTAAEDILSSYKWGNWTQKEMRERKEYWRTTSRNWRITSKVLQQDLSIYFNNANIGSTFQEIVNKRRQLGNSVTNLLRGGTSKSEIDAEVNADQTLINTIEDLLKKCGALMVEETRTPNKT